MLEFDSKFSPGCVFVFTDERRVTLGVISPFPKIQPVGQEKIKNKIYIPLHLPNAVKFNSGLPQILEGDYKTVKDVLLKRFETIKDEV